MAMWNTYVWVESADEVASKVRDAGGAIVMEPFDVMDAGRMAVFTDPEGAVFCAWQAKEQRGAQVVNEHGSLNFNGLNTRDPEGAKSFYGSVFGWTTLGASPAGSRCGRCPATAITSSVTTPECASGWRRWRPRGFRGRRRQHQSDPGRPAGHAGALGRDLRRRRRRRHRREDDGARRAR